ncbi:MAG: hypothetical protein HY738_23085, partial [Bacteroidia bacterium]|nr:hypothetical protein [Bacteroidia bacterium]
MKTEKNFSLYSALTLLFSLTFWLASNLHAQNIAITDDDSYTAHSSAMLDVKSLTKGFLAPRLTTAQRNAISSPATGLLVFDTNLGSYYFYTGSGWTNLTYGTASDIWSYSAPNIYTTNLNDNVGIGTSSPLHKLHIYKDIATTDGTDGNFIDIQNSNAGTGVISGLRFFNGTTANTAKGGIFYQDRLSYGRGDLILANNPTGASGNVTATDARMIIKNEGTVMIKPPSSVPLNRALFHVENAGGDTVFAVYSEGVRVYIADDAAKAAGSRSGFAVGGFSLTKGLTNDFLRVTPDSTRIYTTDTIKGFGIRNISAFAKTSYMQLTPSNYFIGHESGINTTTGLYNSFYGYMAGKTNTQGSNNTFIGYQSGISNTIGTSNIFLGYKSGYANTSGLSNIFIGDQAGKSTTIGVENIFIGYQAGKSNVDGNENIFIGDLSGQVFTTGTYNIGIGTWSGYSLTSGNKNLMLGYASGCWLTGSNNVVLGSESGASINGNNNVMVGVQSGFNVTGSGNIIFGYRAGVNETSISDKLIIDNSDTSTPLIKGDFSSDYLWFNGKVGIGYTANPTYRLYVQDDQVSNDNPAIYGIHAVTDNYGIGVRGVGKWKGVKGDASSASGTIVGVHGEATGAGTGNRYGIYGFASGGAAAYAGYFSGNVHVNGTLSKTAGSFQIDHPLDPA